jgi:hypothetical protein
MESRGSFFNPEFRFPPMKRLFILMALPEPATGRLGLIHNGNPDCIDQLAAWN